MNNSFKKPIVIGIILLFVGVAVQPSTAVTPFPSNNEEDCKICPKISTIKVIEKYQELSDKITTLKAMNKEFNTDVIFPLICVLLSFIYAFGLFLIYTFHFPGIIAFIALTLLFKFQCI